MRKSFKSTFSLEERKSESEKILQKYPDRVPCIVECNDASKTLDKKKYLIPQDLTVGMLITVIRKRLQLSSNKSIFLLIDNTIPVQSRPLSQVYTNNKDIDGFLYITYAMENTFGQFFISVTSNE